MVRAAISRLESNPGDVEELCDDVFVVAFGRLSGLAELSFVAQRTWLARTAEFVVANHGRRMATRKRTAARLRAEPVQSSMPSAEDEVIPPGDELFGLALASLNDAQRQVLQLRALGYDGPSMGRILDSTAAAARKRLMTARAAFIAAHVELKAAAQASEPREGSLS